MCPPPRERHWALVCRSVIEVSLHGHSWFHHWPCTWTHSLGLSPSPPAPILKHLCQHKPIWSEGLMSGSHSYYLTNSKDLAPLPGTQDKFVILQQVIRMCENICTKVHSAMQRWVPFLLLFVIMVIFKVGFILGVCVCVCVCVFLHRKTKQQPLVGW